MLGRLQYSAECTHCALCVFHVDVDAMSVTRCMVEAYCSRFRAIWEVQKSTSKVIFLTQWGKKAEGLHAKCARSFDPSQLLYLHASIKHSTDDES